MSAGIQEHPGNQAGRVTIVTTLTSMLPTFFVVLVAVAAFLLEIISADIAAAVLLTAIGQGSLTSGTVFATAKKTKTDRADVVWGSPPVPDMVNPPYVMTDPVISEGEQDVRLESDRSTSMEPSVDLFEEENRALLADVKTIRNQE